MDGQLCQRFEATTSALVPCSSVFYLQGLCPKKKNQKKTHQLLLLLPAALLVPVALCITLLTLDQCTCCLARAQTEETATERRAQINTVR